jgi:methionine sulfoxide reductase heme-binding subunit
MSVLGHGNAVWFLMRGSGVVALALLTGVLALGIATTGGVRLGRMPRFATLALHRSISLLAVVFLGVHVATAVADPYAAVGLADVVLPFSARAHPIAIGLGALALDLILALVVTSLLRARIGRRTWRAVHWAAYAAWPLAFLHTIETGSDMATLWLRIVALAALAVVGLSVAWRVLGRSPGAAPARSSPQRGRGWA